MPTINAPEPSEPQNVMTPPGSSENRESDQHKESLPKLRNDIDSIAELGINGEISEEKSVDGDESDEEYFSSPTRRDRGARRDSTF